MGAYQALQEHGLSIPGDVSVVSFDDASIAGWLRPGLTTFALPHFSMGKRAADLLISLIEHERTHGVSPAEGGTHLIPMPMRDRDSLGAPRA
jgi:LacI family transcriptional regulator